MSITEKGGVFFPSPIRKDSRDILGSAVPGFGPNPTDEPNGTFDQAIYRGGDIRVEHLDRVRQIPVWRDDPVVPAPPTWMARARCAQSPELSFFPSVGQDIGFLSQFCRGCPVRLECLTYAIDHRILHGVWGGLSPGRRTTLTPKERENPVEVLASADRRADHVRSRRPGAGPPPRHREIGLRAQLLRAFADDQPHWIRHLQRDLPFRAGSVQGLISVLFREGHLTKVGTGRYQRADAALPPVAANPGPMGEALAVGHRLTVKFVDGQSRVFVQDQGGRVAILVGTVL